MAELSGLEVMALVREIGGELDGTYVSAVYSVGSSQVVRFRRPRDGDVWLVVSPRHGAWVSKKVSERAETTEFTSRLRGEIERCRFVGAAQVGLDRVFDLTLGEGEFLRHLVVEMMPPGNIVVTDGAGVVRALLREVRTEKRRVVRGGAYRPPAQGRQSPASLTGEKVAAILLSEKTVGKALGRNVAIPRKYVQEALSRLSLSESAPSAGLEGRADEIASVLRGLVKEVEAGARPSVRGTPEGDEIFVVASRAFELRREATSVGELCDELCLPLVMAEAPRKKAQEEGKRREVEVTIERLGTQENSLIKGAAGLRESAKKAAAAQTLEEALGLLKDDRSRRVAPESKEAVASLLYSEAKRMERKAREARSAAEGLSKRLRSLARPAKKETRQLKRETREWYEKFRWFFTSGGKLAIGGRDSQSNSVLVRRHLEEGDTVYHADLFGSPFFVLKGGRAQTQEEISEVAQATVGFSSAWKTGLGSADAYWVFKDQVGTAAPSGEYLAKGSFMIKGKKNFVEHNLVQVAVGLDERGRVVSGPESAVAKAAVSHVVLSPHREKPSETAKKVAVELEKLTGASQRILLDDVLRAIPAGGGKLVRIKAGKL